MVETNLPNGIYMVWQQSSHKGVDHYGVLDVGNCLRIAQADRSRPTVIHQAPPAITMDTLENSGPWVVVAHSNNIEQSFQTFWQACGNPHYDWLSNNCEHFARSVVLGRRESTQIQNVVVGGALVLAVLGLSQAD